MPEDPDKAYADAVAGSQSSPASLLYFYSHGRENPDEDSSYILHDLRHAALTNHSIPSSSLASLHIHSWLLTGHPVNNWGTWQSFLSSFGSLMELVCYGTSQRCCVTDAILALCLSPPTSNSDANTQEREDHAEEDTVHISGTGIALCPLLRRLRFIGDCTVDGVDIEDVANHLTARARVHVPLDFLELTFLVGADDPRDLLEAEDINVDDELAYWATKYREDLTLMRQAANSVVYTFNVFQ